MKSFQGETLSWELSDGCIEMRLHREPCNEIGSQSLEELEKFVEAHEILKDEANALIFPKEDAEACAAQTARLIKDSELFHRIRLQARRTVEEGFRLEGMVDRIELALKKHAR